MQQRNEKNNELEIEIVNSVKNKKIINYYFATLKKAARENKSAPNLINQDGFESNEKSEIYTHDAKQNWLDFILNKMNLKDTKSVIVNLESLEDSSEKVFINPKKVYNVRAINQIISMLINYQTSKKSDWFRWLRNSYSDINFKENKITITNERELFSMLVIRRLNKYSNSGDILQIHALKEFCEKSSKEFTTNQNNKTHTTMRSICNKIAIYCAVQIELVNKKENEKLFSETIDSFDPCVIIDEANQILLNIICKKNPPYNLISEFLSREDCIQYLKSCQNHLQYGKNIPLLNENKKVIGVSREFPTNIGDEIFSGILNDEILFPIVKKMILSQHRLQELTKILSRGLFNPFFKSEIIKEIISLKTAFNANDFANLKIAGKLIDEHFKMEILTFANSILDISLSAELYSSLRNIGIESRILAKVLLNNDLSSTNINNNPIKNYNDKLIAFQICNKNLEMSLKNHLSMVNTPNDPIFERTISHNRLAKCITLGMKQQEDTCKAISNDAIKQDLNLFNEQMSSVKKMMQIINYSNNTEELNNLCSDMESEAKHQAQQYLKNMGKKDKNLKVMIEPKLSNEKIDFYESEFKKKDEEIENLKAALQYAQEDNSGLLKEHNQIQEKHKLLMNNDTNQAYNTLSDKIFSLVADKQNLTTENEKLKEKIEELKKSLSQNKNYDPKMFGGNNNNNNGNNNNNQKKNNNQY